MYPNDNPLQIRKLTDNNNNENNNNNNDRLFNLFAA